MTKDGEKAEVLYALCLSLCCCPVGGSPRVGRQRWGAEWIPQTLRGQRPTWTRRAGWDPLLAELSEPLSIPPAVLPSWEGAPGLEISNSHPQEGLEGAPGEPQALCKRDFLHVGKDFLCDPSFVFPSVAVSSC